MQFWTSSLILMASANLIAASPITPSSVFKRQGLCLFADVLAPNSGLTGQEEGTTGIKEGQSPSITDANNFINFCTGQLITNGLQANQGSCNPIPMGQIPSVERMISTIILQPAHNENIPAGNAFDVVIQTSNFQAGAFTNPDRTYYSAPQQLNNQGQIIGHAHITISRLGDSPQDTNNLSQPPDVVRPVFFQGIDDAGNGQGQLQVTVQDGLEPGFYRVCTMMSAANHQAVLMPVARRGPQDDCTKFIVTEEGGQPLINPEQDLEDDVEAGIIPPNGQPIGVPPIEGQDPNANIPAPADPNAPVDPEAPADPNVETPAQTPEAAPLPEVIPPVEGEGAPETPLEEAPPVEQQPELEQIREAIVDVLNGFGGFGDFLRISSGVLGGQAPFVMDSGNPEQPFSVNSVLFSTAQEAVARCCRLQFRTCRDKGFGSLEQCAEQRRNCGAEPQDIAIAVQKVKARRALKN